MTNDPTQPPEELQFDQAEFEAVEENQLSCNACQATIATTYFDVSGTTVCPGCRDQIAAAQTGGSGAGRFGKAVLFGVPAAALGSGIYYGISALTGYEFGLVAIVIGLMVGAAVRAGSNRRGGWAYQTLAMVLTYMAIVSTYIPSIVQGFQSMDPVEAEISQPVAPAEEETPTNQPGAAARPDTPAAEEGSFLLGLVGIGLLMAFAMVAPFLMGFENIIGLIIIGIGLYEAWKLNKRSPIEITGPYQVATATAPAEGLGQG